ncbi:hypothetical protein PspLS_06296 [Pyricularia sp. CBS 133598]|nr:hypothetical protein PspLS_06296 [Pyricularia sp. CBS 133598]
MGQVYTEKDKDLCHILLVELLAIETQEYLLNNVNVQRIVEVGPDSTLTKMATRTWQSMGLDITDSATGAQRRFLGPPSGVDEIYYRYDGEAEEPNVEEPVRAAAPPEPTRVVGEPPPQPMEQPVISQPTKAAQQLPVMVDEGITTTDLVVTLVANKLKKQPDEINQGKTIAQLAAGRSTLSNEIIGDLEAEFPGKLPHSLDDVSVADLAEALAAGHGGGLGKATSAMAAKLLTAKFPGGYSGKTLRDRLRDRWGLGPMRQDAVLLLGLTNAPDQRIPSDGEADKVVDDWAKRYLDKKGLSAVVPSEQAWKTSDDNSSSSSNSSSNNKAQSTALAAGKPPQPPAKTYREVDHSADVHAAAQADEIALWRSEHGEDYLEGIRGRFDARKERVFESYWNWNAQAISRLATGTNASAHDPLAILNRADDRSLEQLGWLDRKTGNAAIRSINKVYSIDNGAILSTPPRLLAKNRQMAPCTRLGHDGTLHMVEVERPAGKSGVDSLEPTVLALEDNELRPSARHCAMYREDLERASIEGLSLAGRDVLLTGAGEGSIGRAVLAQLLAAGARVVVTTSRLSRDAARSFERVYVEHGGRGAVLRLVQFNQGSRRDVEGLVAHLDSIGWDLDFIVPFAAVSENGRDVESIDDKAELAHRLMLTNVLRLLGAVAGSKRRRHVERRPATVLLPLSPNHGLMGGDGLYAESKLGLEALLAKWSSEGWTRYLSLVGLIIGWTRGTGLMNSNDVLAQGVESLGVRTFGVAEMAGYVCAVIGGDLAQECQFLPLVVDLGGGLAKAGNFKLMLSRLRARLNETTVVLRTLAEERVKEVALVEGASTIQQQTAMLSRRANLKIGFPRLPDYPTEIAPLAQNLRGMMDLSRVVVVTGFSELGPCGNSRTRWEMETGGGSSSSSNQELSVEGAVEMAWLMGLITHRGGGWVDAETGNAVGDEEVSQRYGNMIRQHSGIRRIEPEVCEDGYDPDNKHGLLEVSLQHDVGPFEVSDETAADMQRRHGDKAVLVRDDTDACFITLKAGAVVMVPRATIFNRKVAGQIPKGWSAKRYGISDDIIHQVDPVTLFALVCTVEALLSSGITDPYEIYQHIHLSELGICIGSSLGGLASTRKMYRDRFVDMQVQSDVLQETFINTTGAWINMLFMSGSGPIRTPVGACATGLESMDAACDLIINRKVKMCIVGGVEDFGEHLSYEFGSMKATCDTDVQEAAGRTPAEMSRPAASSRAGFVEAQGCGVQVLTSAELAIEMGLPIYGIVAYSNLSADKIGRSVPAPGQGVLTNARETATEEAFAWGRGPRSPLNMQHRRSVVERKLQQISEEEREGLSQLQEEVEHIRRTVVDEGREGAGAGAEPEKYLVQNTAAIQREAQRQIADMLFATCNTFWQGIPWISPLRGALSSWGLTVDDLSFASMHGTSTTKNDINESHVLHQQLRHLGRSRGNLLPCVCQKWLTGHPKAAAASWMINGCLQALDTGVVPGNKNLDNVDAKLREYDSLFFPNRDLDAQEMKACSVTSFGFGQKGGQAIIVHPRYLFATLHEEPYRRYVDRRETRCRQAESAFVRGMVYGDLVGAVIKDKAPYVEADLSKALLDPLTRFVH